MIFLDAIIPIVSLEISKSPNVNFGLPHNFHQLELKHLLFQLELIQILTTTFDIEHCIASNYMSLQKINPENIYKNRRQIKTTCSKEDFMILPNQYNLTCTQILVDHFYCDICFNANENSITSYDGREIYFRNKLPLEITNECLSLISNMRMGSIEYTKFIHFQNR